VIDGAYVNLGYAIIEQAANDVKAMQEAGVIRTDGTVVSNADWPKTKDKKGNVINQKINGINKPHEVIELLHWMRGPVGKLPLNDLLSGVGSGLTQKDICKGLKI
jgi:hypothetical protein